MRYSRRGALVAGLGLLAGCSSSPLAGDNDGSGPNTDTQQTTVSPQRARDLFQLQLRVEDEVTTGEQLDVETSVYAPLERPGLYDPAVDTLSVLASFYWNDEQLGSATYEVDPGSWHNDPHDYGVNVADPGQYDFSVEAKAYFDGFEVLKTRSETVQVNSE